METAKVWANNIAAGTGALSIDMWAAIVDSKEFVDSHPGYEITMVGHSKGGGEAIAAAAENNKNAITFNAANFRFRMYGLFNKNASGINNYYVEGEFLNSVIGRSSFGTNHWIDTQYYMVEKQWSFDIFGHPIQIDVKVPAPIANHGMDAFKSAWGLEW